MLAALTNGAGMAYLVYLLATNGVPTAGQPLFIVLLVAAGQLTALALVISSRRPPAG